MEFAACTYRPVSFGDHSGVLLRALKNPKNPKLPNREDEESGDEGEPIPFLIFVGANNQTKMSGCCYDSHDRHRFRVPLSTEASQVEEAGHKPLPAQPPRSLCLHMRDEGYGFGA